MLNHIIYICIYVYVYTSVRQCKDVFNAPLALGGGGGAVAAVGGGGWGLWWRW